MLVTGIFSGYIHKISMVPVIKKTPTCLCTHKSIPLTSKAYHNLEVLLRWYCVSRMNWITTSKQKNDSDHIKWFTKTIGVENTIHKKAAIKMAGCFSHWSICQPAIHTVIPAMMVCRKKTFLLRFPFIFANKAIIIGYKGGHSI